MLTVSNRRPVRRLVAGLLAAALLWGMAAPGPLAAITVREEEELSREFLQVLFQHLDIIREPLVDDYINRLGQRLLEPLPPQPFKFHFYMVDEPTYNAFATPAGHVFINSGLFVALESEEELAGIVGHEIAHVVCRHISKKIERSKKITAATMAGVVAGMLLGAGGGGEAASALTVGSMAAGHSLTLAYSREDEIQADQVGLQNLAQAGFTGQGLLESLKKIRSRQWFGSKEIPTYLTTHPAVEDRMAYIDNWIHHEAPEIPVRPPSDDFRRVHTYVSAVYGEEATARQRFAHAVAESPDDPLAHWGYALVLERGGSIDQARAHLQQALARRPLDPYLLKDLGRIYFLSGQYAKALNVLAGVADGPEPPPEALFYYGRTLLELGRQNEALRTLDTLVARHPDYPSARYFLGEAFGRAGRLAEAHYHLGLYHWAQRDKKNARFHLERALEEMPDGMRREEIRDILDQMNEKKEKTGLRVGRK